MRIFAKIKLTQKFPNLQYGNNNGSDKPALSQQTRMRISCLHNTQSMDVDEDLDPKLDLTSTGDCLKDSYKIRCWPKCLSYALSNST